MPSRSFRSYAIVDPSTCAHCGGCWYSSSWSLLQGFFVEGYRNHLYRFKGKDRIIMQSVRLSFWVNSVSCRSFHLHGTSSSSHADEGQHLFPQ